MPNAELTKRVLYSANERVDLNDKLAEERLLDDYLHEIAIKGQLLDTQASTGKDRYGRILYGWRTIQTTGPNPGGALTLVAEYGLAFTRAGEPLVQVPASAFSVPLTSNTINYVHVRYREDATDLDNRRFYDAILTEVTQNVATRTTRTADLYVTTAAYGGAITIGGFSTSVTVGPDTFELVPLYAVEVDAGGNITKLEDWRPLFSLAMGNKFDLAVPDLPHSFAGLNRGITGIRAGLIALADRIKQIKQTTNWHDDLLGMCIGFTGTPTANHVLIGDANFGLQFVSASDLKLRFSASAYISYNRSTDNLAITTTWSSLTLSGNALSLGDSLFRLVYATPDPQLQFHTGDWLGYHRTLNQFTFVMGNVEHVKITASGQTIVSGGLSVGFDGSPIADCIQVGDADFRIRLNGAIPTIGFTASDADGLSFDRSVSRLYFAFSSALKFMMTAGGFHPVTTLTGALGLNALRWGEVHAGKGVFSSVATTVPSGAHEACQRNGLNAVVSCGYVTAGSPPTVSGNHWNVTSVAMSGWQYLIYFDEQPAADSVILVTPTTDGVIATGRVMTGYAYVYLMTHTGSYTTGNFSFAIIGRPNSAP